MKYTVALISASLARGAFACAVCFGDINSKMNEGSNFAIALLLGVTIATLAGMGFTFRKWVKRWD